MSATQTVASPEANLMEKGYHVFSNVLTATEVANLRQETRAHFATGGRDVTGGGKKQANAAAEVPTIEWLFRHPKVLDSFRQALGSESIMFTSHADVQKDVLNNWHKDDGTNEEKPNEIGYFSRFSYDIPDCRVYKMGVYLQDHDQDGFGLTVREGSHRTKSFTEGKVHYTGAPIGNVVIFDVRITHSGQFKTPMQTRFFKYGQVQRGPIGTTLVKARKWYRSLLGRERIASFFTFGAQNQHTIDFSVSNMRRQLRLTPGTTTKLPDTLRAAFNKEGVTMAADHFPNFE